MIEFARETLVFLGGKKKAHFVLIMKVVVVVVG